MAVEYISGAELPDIGITWNDADTGLIDFSSGWTFTVRVGQTGQAAAVTKTTGITGAATAPNVVISWTAAELDTLAAGGYTVNVIANQTATNKDRIQEFQMTIKPAITAGV